MRQAIRGRFCGAWAVCATALVPIPVKAAKPAIPPISSIWRRVKRESIASVVEGVPAALAALSIDFSLMMAIRSCWLGVSIESMGLRLLKHSGPALCLPALLQKQNAHQALLFVPAFVLLPPV